ncbi:MAG: hypothetical protein BWZ02_00156 [Lentisphaerae bacterium ADurb.BinA184]|nr:MAG: hypothetical protein BWZ02_00156 [Lentisphaerae bacterium ADurb.BinA184]
MASSVALPATDRTILRDLLERYAEAAAHPDNARRRREWTALNGLQPTRPLLWINEICWHEFAAEPELQLRTSHAWSRGWESRLRLTLYQWRHFPGDMILDPVLYTGIRCGPTSTYADYGIQASERKVAAGLDGTASFEPVINSEADVERLRVPEVTVDWDGTACDLATLRELCDGIIPCATRGLVHQWAAAWDQMIHWYGIERLYLDMCDRPALVHRLLERFWAAVNTVLDRQIELGLLATGDGNWRVGSGGLGCTTELPPPDCDPAHVRPADQWGCSTGQIFSEVSPDMHWEFCLQYEKPYMERFGLSYYGCCEPLHRKVGILRRVKNLRKISISPWADLEVAAREIGTDYVISFKPNPAYLAHDHWQPELVREYLRSSLERLRGCRVEVILKDISTIRGEPRRLAEWEKVARAVIAEWSPA